jgi:catechol 2,3-dioxygenase-like lactoylglutathione lyase family enzyme
MRKDLVFTASVLALISFGCAKLPVEGEAIPNVVLGGGRGLDHVGIVVRDLQQAVQSYAALGFSTTSEGAPHGGLRNVGIMFGSNYLELISVDKEKVANSSFVAPYIDFLTKREGAGFVALDVSSAQDTYTFLRAKGLDVTEPQASKAIDEQTKQPQTNLWKSIDFNKPVVPPDALGFVEYTTTRGTNVPPHSNTAVRLVSVWMAVTNLDSAIKAYASVGLPPGRQAHHDRLGGAGREIPAGQGSIMLLEPNSAGPLASFCAKYGEGIIAVTLEVGDLRAARTMLESKFKQPLEPYRSSGREAILIPSELAHGVFIELLQQRT